MREFDVTIAGGGVLHAYDAGTGGAHALPVVWHHGTPNIGTPPRPLLDHADRLGLRLVGYDRPGYGGSTPRPDRTVASAAADVAAVVDALEAPDAAGAQPGLSFAVPALAAGPAPLIDDDLAYVRDWGFEPSSIRSPVRLVHGILDRVVPAAHSEQLAQRIPHAVMDLTPDDGHVSILRRAAAALEWIAAQRDDRPHES